MVVVKDQEASTEVGSHESVYEKVKRQFVLIKHHGDPLYIPLGAQTSAPMT
jgi:hypothetical protein